MAMRGEITSLVNRIEQLERQIRQALDEIVTLERKVRELEQLVHSSRRY